MGTLTYNGFCVHNWDGDSVWWATVAKNAKLRMGWVKRQYQPDAITVRIMRQTVLHHKRKILVTTQTILRRTQPISQTTHNVLQPTKVLLHKHS